MGRSKNELCPSDARLPSQHWPWCRIIQWFEGVGNALNSDADFRPPSFSRSGKRKRGAFRSPLMNAPVRHINAARSNDRITTSRERRAAHLAGGLVSIFLLPLFY